MSGRNEILQQFLDGLVQEIRDIEHGFGLRAGPQDYRCPVEHWHDAVDAWRQRQQSALQPELHDRLSVGSIAADVAGLRQRAQQLAHYGASLLVPLPSDLPWHGWWPQVMGRKQQCLLQLEALEIPWPLIQREIAAFRQLSAHQNLKQLLEQRYAMRRQQTEGEGSRWLPLTPGVFQQAWEQAEPALAKDKPPRSATERGAIQRLWLQTVHPLVIWLCIRGQVFDPQAYIPQRDWQDRQLLAQQLSEAYERYTVLFAAALAEDVNHGYREELAGLEQLMKDCNQLTHWLNYAENEGQPVDRIRLERWVRELDNEALKQRLLAILDADKADTSGGGMKNGVQTVLNEARQELEELEQAHFQFLNTQLALFEKHKPMVRELAAKGLNLAGQFVAAAAAVSSGRGKDSSRGR